MRKIEEFVSPFIEQQFPDFYKEEGPNFIAFVKAYYEWLESEGNVISESRKLPTYRDIDTTVDDFVLLFKEKYLKNIQLNTATNTKLLVKNSLDLYRSKGSENSIDLFFKLVYGTNAEVKNPSENLFKLSSGDWIKPIYIEVSETKRNIDYVGKKIFGNQSRASAFVERYIKRKTSSGYVCVLDLSDLTGDFQNGETLSISSESGLESFDDSPRVIGSLKAVEIVNSAGGFNVGEIVKLKSAFSGLGALARVVETSSRSGAVDFEFLDGGWGYTANSVPVIAERTLFLENASSQDDELTYFKDQIYQPLCDIKYSSSEILSVGDILQGNTGTAVVVDSDFPNAKLSLTSGFLCNSFTYTVSGGNFTITDLSNDSTLGRVVESPETVVIYVDSSFSSVSEGDEIFQEDHNGIFFSGSIVNLAQNSIECSVKFGYPKTRTHNPRVNDEYAVTFNSSTAVNNANYSIASANNEFANGSIVLYSANTSTISGLQNNERYWVVEANTSSFKLSNTRFGSPVQIISTVASENHRITLDDRVNTFARFSANSSFIQNRRILLDNSMSNAFRDGDIVVYRSPNPIVPLVDGQSYFVISSNSSSLALSSDGSTSLDLVASNLNIENHSLERSFALKSRRNGILTDYSGAVSGVDCNIGLYDIRKSHASLSVSNTNVSQLSSSSGLILQDENNFRFKIHTLSQTGANTALITGQILSGQPDSFDLFITDDGRATGNILDWSSFESGGDFSLASGCKIFSRSSSLEADCDRQSEGFGATFAVAGVSNVQDVYINTDIVDGSSIRRLDSKRSILNLPTANNINLNDTVFQDTSYEFNTNQAGLASGVITVASTAGLENGDIVYYDTAATLLRMNAGSVSYEVPVGTEFYIAELTPTTFKLRSNIDGPTETFVVGASATHFFVKRNAIATVFAKTANTVSVRDVFGTFSNTTTLRSYSNASINVAVNTVSSLSTSTIPEGVLSKNLVRSSTYGFTKNPISDINTNIYNSLNFQKFSLGTVNNITAVNPGADYNAPPAVRIVEPFIADLDRRDLILTLGPVTSNFNIGERITQTTANLIFYDLSVDGVNDGTVFSPYSVQFDSKIDVDDSSDFIFDPSLIVELDTRYDINYEKLRFDGLSDVNSVQNTIRKSPDVNLSLGDSVLYIGNGQVGLVNGQSYTVSSSNSTSIKLSNSSVVEIDVFPSGGDHLLLKAANDVLSVKSDSIQVNDLVRYVRSGSSNIGLTNNQIYRVHSSNNSGTVLKYLSNDSIVDLSSNTESSGHQLRFYKTRLENDDTVVFNFLSGANIGLTSNTLYFVVGSNSAGFSVSSSANGAKIALTPTVSSDQNNIATRQQGFVPGQSVSQNAVVIFNGNTGVFANNILANHPFVNGDILTYTTNATSITGANNTQYLAHVINASAIQLRNVSTNSTISLTQTSGNHYLSLKIEGNLDEVFNNKLRVSGSNRAFVNGYFVELSSNPNIKSLVSNVVLSSRLVTASGIVKEFSFANNTLKVKRTTFENNFVPSEESLVFGDFSGSYASVLGVKEDETSDQIGYNANINNPIVTANGSIKVLEVVDSGFGYSNSEIMTVVSDNESISATAKSIISGSGKSRGFYKSSKGFLSNDMKLFDGDYYQEYSYEVLTKISFDRYKDIFKKVLHLAGTKVFGSTLISEENTSFIDSTDRYMDVSYSFNSNLSISSGRLLVLSPSKRYEFDSNLIDPNGDFIRMNHDLTEGRVVKYFTQPGTVPNIGLSNNQFYWIETANSTAIAVSSTKDGNRVNLSQSVSSTLGHVFESYDNPFKDGDIVKYSTDWISVSIPFEETVSPYEKNTKVIYNSRGNTDVAPGLVNNKEYYTSSEKESALSITDGVKYTDVLVDTSSGFDDLRVVLLDSRERSSFDINNLSGYSSYVIYNGSVTVNDHIITNESITKTVGNTSNVLNNFGQASPIARIRLFTKIIPEIAANSYSVQTEDLVNLIVSSAGFVLPQDSGKRVDVLASDLDFGRAQINTASNSILLNNQIPAEPYTVLVPTSVSNSTIFVNNSLLKNDVVKYIKRGSGEITGLTTLRKYYVSFANSSCFRVSEEFDGANINVSSSNLNQVIFRTSNSSSKRARFESGDIVVFNAERTSTTIKNLSIGEVLYVSNSNNTSFALSEQNPVFDIVNTDGPDIEIGEHNLVVGDQVYYSKEDPELLSIGLSENISYYVVTATENTISLSATANGSPITLSNIVPGHRLVSQKTIDLQNSSSVVNPYLSVSDDYSMIIDNDHEFEDGDQVIYSSEAGSRKIKNLPENVTANSQLISSNRVFANNDFKPLMRVLYRTSSTPIAGLSNNSTYIVGSSNSTSFELLDFSSRRVIDLASSVGNHEFIPVLFVTGSNTTGFSVSTTSVGKLPVESPEQESMKINGFLSVSSNNIMSNNTLQVGERIVYNTDTGITPISGLTNNSVYFVRTVNSSSFSLSITSGGSTVSITPTRTNSVTVDNVLTVNPTLDRFVFAHPYSTGDEVTYTSATPVSGLSNGSSYVVRNANSSSFQLSSNSTSNIIELAPSSGTGVFEITQTPQKSHRFITFSGNTSTFESLFSESGYTIKGINTGKSGHTLSVTRPMNVLSENQAYEVYDSDDVSIKLVGVDLAPESNSFGHRITKVEE